MFLKYGNLTIGNIDISPTDIVFYDLNHNNQVVKLNSHELVIGQVYVTRESWGVRGSVTISVDDKGRGFIDADTKNFKMQHPKDSNTLIYYSSIEGPEVGAYERGSIQSINGETYVKFSSHFNELINVETTTIQLTPNSLESLGLCILCKELDGFRVKELFNGNGNYSIDWR